MRALSKGMSETESTPAVGFGCTLAHSQGAKGRGGGECAPEPLTQATEEVGISGTDRCIPVALEDGAEHGRRASRADSECTLAPVLTKRSK